jgi:hypothetical protein
VSARGLLAALAGGALALAAQVVLAATPAWADDPLVGSTTPGLRVAPVHVSVPPDVSQYTAEFELANPTARPETVSTSVVELSLSGKLLPSTIASADHWLKVDPDSADLAPGERRLFHVHVAVPEQREPGERRVGVVFFVKAVPAPGSSAVAGSIALVPSVWIPGSGDVVQRVRFGRLSAPLVADWSPIPLDLEVANLGNVHSDFGYGGTTIAASTSVGSHFNFAPLTVLSDSTAVAHAVWSRPPALCWCEVLVATDDGSGRTISARTHVFVLPVRIGVGLLTAVVGLSLLFGALRRRATARRLAELEAARQEGIRIGRSGGP